MGTLIKTSPVYWIQCDYCDQELTTERGRTMYALSLEDIEDEADGAGWSTIFFTHSRLYACNNCDRGQNRHVRAKAP